jgi:hypothetical protein
MFKQLKLSEWQQFQQIDVEFHSRLTILTGANGSGKTTILGNILARHSGWNFQSGSVPKKEGGSGLFRFFPRLWNGESRDEQTIGELIYENGNRAQIQIPYNPDSPQYQIGLNGQQIVKSLFIPSHRSVFRYQSLGNIPIGKKNKDLAFNEVYDAQKQRLQGGGGQPTSMFMKNTLIGWAIQGYGNEVIEGDREQIKYYEGFKEVLKKILPESLGFQNLEIRKMEIIFVCNNKKDEFVFEQASGGISALIDIAWHIYMFVVDENDSCTIIIDEIENHLHPIMQRQILPDLLKAFPNCRFVVSTHSPLVVGSVQDSSVYAFRHNSEGKIVSERLDLVDKAKTAAEILDEVLGVSFTMPVWAEEKLKAIVLKYSSKAVNKEELSNMRNELKEMGLEKFMPEAVCDVIDKQI